MNYEIVPIRLASGEWIIRRETMTDDCATILATHWYSDSINQLSCWTIYQEFATRTAHRPSVEVLNNLENCK